MALLMLGYLIRCGGGRTIPLPRPRLIISQRQEPSVAGTRIAHAELVYQDGVWSVEQLPGGATLRINGVPCEYGTLLAGDVIAVGSLRFRMASAEPDPKRLPSPASAIAPRATAFGVLVPCGGGPAIPLKSAADNVGGMALAQAAERLEGLARNQRHDEIPQAHAQVVAEWERLVPLLRVVAGQVAPMCSEP